MKRAVGYGFLGVYVLGHWCYTGYYMWENWAGFWLSGTLAYYASMRAMIWPVWVVLALAT